MSLAANCTVEILLRILPGILIGFSLMLLFQLFLRHRRVSEYFFSVQKLLGHLGLNKRLADLVLVFTCRQKSAIHDVKVGKSLVSVIVLIKLPIK